MKFDVISLRRADADVDFIFREIHTLSPQGALAWLDAYEALLNRLAENADIHAPAHENDDFDIPLKQVLFRTRRGKTYRAVYTIVGDQVRILRVRGPGQPPLHSDEEIL